MIVHEEWFPKIRDNYQEYESFLSQEKSLSVNPLSLNKEKRKESCSGNFSVNATLPSGGCRLLSTVSLADQQDYKLKVRAEYFHNAPCFRFCSKGRSHMNREAGTGLPQRAVETPHFHKVEQDGVLRAYQPPEFSDPEYCTKALDLGVGLNLFCSATGIFAPDKKPVTYRLLGDSGTLFQIPADPLLNAQFPL